MEAVCEGEGTASAVAGLAGTCRFCGARGSSGLLAIGNVCADHQCQVSARSTVLIVLILH